MPGYFRTAGTNSTAAAAVVESAAASASPPSPIGSSSILHNIQFTLMETTPERNGIFPS